MKFDGIFEGGGSKSVALVGAIDSIISRGFEPARVAGASAGAITAGILAAGYTPNEMKRLMVDLDFTDFQDGSRFKTKRIWDLLRHLGMYRGDIFHDWISKLLEKKGLRTFGDLSVENEVDPRWRWKLKVIVSDVTKQRLLIFPDDAILFDIDPNRLKIAYTIRASMSIPFYFRPIKMGNSYLIDGGSLSNYPIWLFDADREPRHPTFGLLLQEDPKEEKDLITGTSGFKRAFQFGSDIIQTMMKSHDRRFVRPEDFVQRTIAIPVGDVGTTEFDLSSQRKETLYHNGKTSANDFLDSWKWESYLQWSEKVRGYDRTKI
jgi:NTE family protein